MTIRMAGHCLIAGLLALVSMASASAQMQDDRYPNLPQAGGAGPVGPSVDDYVARLVEERRQGFIYIDAAVSPGNRCANMRIIVARNVEGRWIPTTISSTTTFFGVQRSFGGTATLDPGDYAVTHVLCINYGSRQILVGPFARFRVNGGEVLNVGTLTLYLGVGSAPGKLAITGKSVGGMRAEARAAFRQQNPKTAARMVDRYMVAFGAAQAGTGASPPKPPSAEFLRDNTGGQIME